jgi:hypothetical protein
MPLVVEQCSIEGFPVQVCIVPSASGAVCVLIKTPVTGLVIAHVHIELEALDKLLEEYDVESEN